MRNLNTFIPIFLLSILSITIYAQDENEYNQDNGNGEIGKYYALFTKTCDEINIETQKYLIKTIPDINLRMKYDGILTLCDNINNSGSKSATSLKELLRPLPATLRIAEEIEREKVEYRKTISDGFASNLKKFTWFCKTKIPENRTEAEIQDIHDNNRRIMSQGIKEYNRLKAELNPPSAITSPETPVQEQINDSEDVLPEEELGKTQVSTDSINQVAKEDTQNPTHTNSSNPEITNEDANRLKEQLAMRDREIAHLERQLSKNGLTLLYIPVWDEIKETPLPYAIKLCLILIIILITYFFSKRIYKIRKAVSYRLIFYLEKELISTENSIENKEKLMKYFAKQPWDDRIKKRCRFFSEFNLKFWDNKPDEIAESFKKKIKLEVKDILQVKTGQQENKTTFSPKSSIAGPKPSFSLTQQESKDKFNKIIDTYLTEHKTAKDAQKVATNFVVEVDSKINSLTQNGFQNKKSYEEAANEFEHFLNQLIQKVKNRIYEDEYHEKIEAETTSLSDKFYQYYSKSLDAVSIDKIISEESDYFKEELFQQPFYEIDVFKNSFIAFGKRTKKKIDSYIASLNTFYLPFPGPGFFIDSKKSRTFNNESAFILTTTTEKPNEAKFQFVEKTERKNNAVKNYRRFLQPVCAFDSSPVNAKDFIVKEEGMAIRHGDKWMVSEDNKMRIEFTY